MRKPPPPTLKLFLEPTPAWMKRAACRRYPAHWWFLDGEERENVAALRICRTSCPVLRECLKQANDWTDCGRRPYGVIMAGVKWTTAKYKYLKPAFRPCICCGGMIPPWVHGNKTRCADCVKQGAKA